MEKLIKKYDRTPLKCDIRCLTAMKVSLDDILCQTLRVEKNYKQSTTVTDIRIIIGLVSTALASYLTYLSLYSEFKAYKGNAMIIIGAYFAVNLMLEAIMRLYNKGCIFCGKNEKGTIKVYSSLKSPDTNYVVMVYKNGKVIPEKYNKDVCNLFDESGTLLHKAYLNDLDEFMNEEGKKDK